jgi:hypothetical protein
MKRTTVIGALVTSATMTSATLLSVPAGAQQRVGSQFLDPPEQPGAEQNKKAAPKDENSAPGYIPGYQRGPSVGLSPHAPQNVPGLPGLFTPAFGSRLRGNDLRFEFHGYMQTAIRAGLGTRDTALEGQKKLTLHGDPIVPGGSYGWLDHINSVPGPWAQLNFSYGNDDVQATAIIGAWSLGRSQDAASYQQLESQIWFNDVFLTYTPDIGTMGLRVLVGAYGDRYGAMAQYSNGQYGIPLIGQINGMGVTSTLQLPLEGDIDVAIEAGFKGDLNRVPVGILLDASSNFPRPEQGSTYAAHAHVSATWKNITPAVHYIRSWSQDDRYRPVDDPLTNLDDTVSQQDGSLDIIGADLRANMARFGYVYVGGMHAVGHDVVSMSNLVQMLNSGGGYDLTERFWGFQSEGNGKLTVLGGEYTISLGTLLRYPVEFWGIGPDLLITLFGIYAKADGACDQFLENVDPETRCVDGRFDTDTVKFGSEGVYSFSKHVAASLRLDYVSDYVRPNLDDSTYKFGAIAPKLIFRSDWITRETISLQYYHYLFGDNLAINGDQRLVNTNSQNPDRHVFAIFGSMWW